MNTNTIAEVTDLRGLVAAYTCVSRRDVRDYLMWMHLDTVTGIVTGTDGNRAAQAQVLRPSKNGTQFLWKPVCKPSVHSTRRAPMLMARGEKTLELRLAGKKICCGEHSTDPALMEPWRGILEILTNLLDGRRYYRCDTVVENFLANL